MRKKRVFVDSSVIIAALFSSTGGSSMILTTLNYDSFIFETNEYAIVEMKRAFSKKFKDESLADKLYLLLGLSNIQVLPDPDPSFVKRMEKHVSKNDVTILASAMIHSDYLLTLDNGFFKDSVVAFANKHNVSILKPKDFIEMRK